MFDLNLSQQTIPLPDKTDVVDFVIKVNDKEISKEIGIVSIEVEHSFNRIATASIIITDGSAANQEFTVSDQNTFSPGNEIEILVGYLPEKHTIFKGIIIKHAIRICPKGQSKLEIECKNKAVKMTVGRKNKYFYELSDSEIIEDISRKNSIKSNVEKTNYKHEEMVQYFCTDWDFILTRAEANGMLVLTNNNKLEVKSPDFEQESAFTVNYGTSLFEFEAEMDARNQYPSAKATSWDSSKQEIIEATSSPNGSTGISGNQSSTDFSKVIGISDYLIQHSGAIKLEELQNWAKAQISRSKIARNKGRAKISGIAKIEPGKVIFLKGVGTRHSGSVYITAVRHEINNGNWFTHLQFGLSHEWFLEVYNDIQDKAAGKLLPGINGLQIGIVTKLENDPQGKFRILVRLPIIDKTSDGIWARIALQDAGNTRSAFFMPEIGDEVIVGFINDDPRDAIVLGMLHSTAKAAPFTASDENHQKGWQTRSGIKMVFDDEKSSWTLETPAKNKIIVDDDASNIILEDQHGNKIKMDAEGITLESSKNLILKASGDVKTEGVNIENKASANFKSEGAAGTELTSTATLTIKGSLVQIN